MTWPRPITRNQSLRGAIYRLHVTNTRQDDEEAQEVDEQDLQAECALAAQTLARARLTHRAKCAQPTGCAQPPRERVCMSILLPRWLSLIASRSRSVRAIWPKCCTTSSRVMWARSSSCSRPRPPRRSTTCMYRTVINNVLGLAALV